MTILLKRVLPNTQVERRFSKLAALALPRANAAVYFTTRRRSILLIEEPA
jgi:hypothetical protein